MCALYEILAPFGSEMVQEFAANGAFCYSGGTLLAEPAPDASRNLSPGALV